MSEPADLTLELRDKILARLNLADVDPATITAATPLFKDGLGLDSLDALEITVMIEELYGIVIAVSERDQAIFGTLGALAAFIEKNLGRDRPALKRPGAA